MPSSPRRPIVGRRQTSATWRSSVRAQAPAARRTASSPTARRATTASSATGPTGAVAAPARCTAGIRVPPVTNVTTRATRRPGIAPARPTPRAPTTGTSAPTTTALASAPGLCQPGRPVVCEDRDACTADTCDPMTGLCHFDPIGGCCNSDVDCNDDLACTDDRCDVGTHACSHTDTCDDGVFCNGVETCNPSTGKCDRGTPVDCSDHDVCTMDSCNEAARRCENDPLQGCCHENLDCNDHDACTVDTCDTITGMCHHTSVDCKDANACMTDTCDSATGCRHDPVTCDDGSPCTVDFCDQGMGCMYDPIPGCCLTDGKCGGNICTGFATCGADHT